MQRTHHLHLCLAIYSPLGTRVLPCSRFHSDLPRPGEAQPGNGAVFWIHSRFDKFQRRTGLLFAAGSQCENMRTKRKNIDFAPYSTFAYDLPMDRCGRHNRPDPQQGAKAKERRPGVCSLAAFFHPAKEHGCLVFFLLPFISRADSVVTTNILFLQKIEACRAAARPQSGFCDCSGHFIHLFPVL